MERYKRAVARLKDERVGVFPLVERQRIPDVIGTCMATHDTPVDHAALGASLLAALRRPPMRDTRPMVA